MEEKIIREKNHTSMKKIANDDRLRLGQMRVETRDSRALGKFLKNKRTKEGGGCGLWSRGDGGVRDFVLACWEKKKGMK